jgi:hypothetical protein
MVPTVGTQAGDIHMQIVRGGCIHITYAAPYNILHVFVFSDRPQHRDRLRAISGHTRPYHGASGFGVTRLDTIWKYGRQFTLCNNRAGEDKASPHGSGRDKGAQRPQEVSSRHGSSGTTWRSNFGVQLHGGPLHVLVDP